jgi:hypothetical protein
MMVGFRNGDGFRCEKLMEGDAEISASVIHDSTCSFRCVNLRHRRSYDCRPCLWFWKLLFGGQIHCRPPP